MGCCGLLLLTLIPLFRLTVYAVPYYDDYNFGRFARAAMEQEQLAALQGISGDVYESAEIDGASRWQCFWRITLPIIKEPLAISTILNLIGIVSCFNTIWLMTKGGPLYSTEIVYTYAYRRAFIDHNFGTAAAASVVLFVFMAVFSGVYLKMVSEKE